MYLGCTFELWGLKLSDILTIIALIAGPIMAVQVQKLIERNTSGQNKRKAVFKTLMATRGSVLSSAHVESLNIIDLEFTGEKYEKVVAARTKYFDNLNLTSDTEDGIKEILNKREDLLLELLLEMGKTLGYNFTKEWVKRNTYSPMAHFNWEQENQKIRTELIRVLTGQQPISFSTPNAVIDEESADRLKRLQDLVIEYYIHENAKFKS
jgi:hypothetical protein